MYYYLVKAKKINPQFAEWIKTHPRPNDPAKLAVWKSERMRQENPSIGYGGEITEGITRY